MTLNKFAGEFILKKLIMFIAAALCTCALMAAPKTSFIENDDGSVSITAVDKDASVKSKQKVDGFNDVTVITGSKLKKNNPITFDLSALGGKEVYINFSTDIKITGLEDSEIDMIWMINDIDAGMPVIFDRKVKVNEWITVKGERAVPLGQNKLLYLSGAGIDKSALTVYMKNIDVRFSGDGLSSKQPEPVDWRKAPSLKEAYKGKIDKIGIAVTYKGCLADTKIQEGLERHASSITMGNELKPDFLFNWASVSKTMEDFTAEDGKIYKMPKGMPNYGSLKEILFTTQMIGVKMRGHVLVWHSQTPDWFFRENFSQDKKSPLTSKEEMNARLEWYIKSVLGQIDEWEKKYNGGEHIIYAWDVVNEAVSDGAGSKKWLREDSNWFRIYGDESFIINAFRFANKYAPKDVELVYNDYGCSNPGKRDAICRLVDEIKQTPDARIDAVGMQSHVRIDSAVTGTNSHEDAVKAFISHDVDVHITELDIANGSKPYSPVILKAKYKEYYKMFLANRKTQDKHGISSVTVWGVTDDGTWLDNQNEYKGHKQYPLLLNGDYSVKPAFYGVLEAAAE